MMFPADITRLLPSTDDLSPRGLSGEPAPSRARRSFVPLMLRRVFFVLKAAALALIFAAFFYATFFLTP